MSADVTADLYLRLRARYDDRMGGSVFLAGVGDGAGHGNSGWSDGIAMQTWPSKGLLLTGFEIKASRGDWLKELDKPGKNATWQEFCGEWYIVAPDDIVQLAELPTSWGLIVPKGEAGLRIAKRSERPPQPSDIPLDLIAAVFRAASSDRIAYRQHVRAEMAKADESNAKKDAKRFEAERDEYRDKWRALSEAMSGNDWDDPAELSRRAKLLKAVDPERVRKRARFLAHDLVRVAKELRTALREYGADDDLADARKGKGAR